MDDTLTLAQAGPPGLEYDPTTKSWRQPGVTPVTPAQPPSSTPATPPQPPAQPPDQPAPDQKPGPPGMEYDPTTKSWRQPGVAPVTPPEPKSTVPPSVAGQELRSTPPWQGVHDAIDSLKQALSFTRSDDPNVPAGGLSHLVTRTTFGLNHVLESLVGGVESMQSGGTFADGYHRTMDTLNRQERLYGQIYPVGSSITGGAGIAAQVPIVGPAFSTEATLGGTLRNVAVGSGIAGGERLAETGDIKEAGKAALAGGIAGAFGPMVGSVIPEIVSMTAPSLRARAVAGETFREGQTAQPPSPPSPGRPGLTTPPAPAAGMPDFPTNAPSTATFQAGARSAGAVPGAEQVMGTESNRLWNVPTLSDPAGMSSATAKRYVADEVANITRTEPGTAHMFDPLNQGDGAKIRAAIEDLNAMPDTLAANQLNMVSSRLRKIARTTNDDNVARVANRMADRVSQGIYDAPEALSNPAIQSDLRAARSFTQREASFYDDNNFTRILRNNNLDRQGLPTVANLDDFMRDIQTSWRNLSGSNPWYDPVTIQGLRDDLVNGARDWVGGKMMESVTRMQAGRRSIDLDKLTDWMEKNRGFLRSSGIFTNEQMNMLEYMGEMSQRVSQSPTFNTLAGSGPKKWIDLFAFGPLKRAIIGGTAGAAMEAVRAKMGGVFGDPLLAATLGFMEVGGGIVGGIKGLDAAFQRLYSMPRERAMQWIQEGLRDPQVAHDLMQTANRWSSFSDATKRWVTLGMTENTADLEQGGKSAAAQGLRYLPQ